MLQNFSSASRAFFCFFFSLWNDKMVKWHDWGHIFSYFIHVLHNTFYNNKKSSRYYYESKERCRKGIETWKTHVLNKNKCVYIMQRFVIKKFNVMLQHFFKIFKYYHTDGFFPSFQLQSGLHSGFLFSTILDGSSASLSKETRCRTAISRIRFRKEYLGARYILCEWKTVVFSYSNNQQWVHSSASFWFNH